MRRMALATGLVLAVLFGGAADVRAQRRGRLRVRVVDVAAGRAYVQPGADRGLHPGATVVIRRRRFRVVGVTPSYAVFETRDLPVRAGLRGVAVVERRRDEEGAEGLSPVRPLAAYRGQWHEPSPPSAGQSPEHVPLGVVRDDRRVRATLAAAGGALVPLGDTGGSTLGRGELRARVTAEPFRELPLRLDADAAVRMWLGPGVSVRDGAASRPKLFVRALELGLGDRTDLYAGLGRLRYAASTLGMLDGVRVQSPSFGGLTLAAFGGYVPDLLDGRPAMDASRFGAELTYRDPEAAWRPMLSVVAHASRFEGALDERRLTVRAESYPDRARLGAHAELSLFDADNPWGAREVELTAAGVDGSLRLGAARLGARVDVRQPERSRWLASALPSSYLCNAENPGGCSLGDRRWLATVDGGITLGDADLAAGATAIRMAGDEDLDRLVGFVQARAIHLLGAGRADLTLSGSTGAFVDTAAVRLGVGAAFLADRLDLSVHYRPSVLRYEASSELVLQHGAGLAARVSPTPDVDLTLGVDGTSGGDVDALLVQANAVWRTGF